MARKRTYVVAGGYRHSVDRFDSIDAASDGDNINPRDAIRLAESGKSVFVSSITSLLLAHGSVSGNWRITGRPDRATMWHASGGKVTSAVNETNEYCEEYTMAKGKASFTLAVASMLPFCFSVNKSDMIDCIPSALIRQIGPYSNVRADAIMEKLGAKNYNVSRGLGVNEDISSAYSNAIRSGGLMTSGIINGGKPYICRTYSRYMSKAVEDAIKFDVFKEFGRVAFGMLHGSKTRGMWLRRKDSPYGGFYYAVKKCPPSKWCNPIAATQIIESTNSKLASRVSYIQSIGGLVVGYDTDGLHYIIEGQVPSPDQGWRQEVYAMLCYARPRAYVDDSGITVAGLPRNSARWKALERARVCRIGTL